MELEKASSMKEEISWVFSCLHDGGIEELRQLDTSIRMKVEITYLTERIQPDFHFFALTLFNVTKFEFVSWEQDFKSGVIDQISDLELEINSSKYENDTINVTCITHGKSIPGGTLHIDANGYELRDEAERRMSYEELASICKRYWEDFSKRKY